MSPLEESLYSYEDVIALMHSSFDERIQQGLYFTCSTLTAPQFREKTKDSIVLVAWDSDSKELLGTVTITMRKDRKGTVYGYHEYLAISPKAKRLGVGTKLLEELVVIINRVGGQYILSDTAVGAKSSVRWHKKNGFMIIGLMSYESTNYYSYLFRRQLVPSFKWSNPFFCWVLYVKSSVNIRLRRKADGSSTRISSIIKKLLNRCEKNLH